MEFGEPNNKKSLLLFQRRSASDLKLVGFVLLCIAILTYVVVTNDSVGRLTSLETTQNSSTSANTFGLNQQLPFVGPGDNNESTPNGFGTNNTSEADRNTQTGGYSQTDTGAGTNRTPSATSNNSGPNLTTGSQTAGTNNTGTAKPKVDNSFPKTRSAEIWPFASDSFWNMPIHNDARYISVDIRSGKDNIRRLSVDQDIIILEPSAPLRDIRLSTVGWGPGVDGEVRCGGTTSAVHRRLPIPDDFFTINTNGRDGTTGNHATAILGRDGRTIYSFGPFERCTNGTAGPYGAAAISKNHPTNDDAITDIFTGIGRRGNHGGSGLSSIGGTIRVGELVPGGAIRHALKINLWAHQDLSSKASVNGGNQYVWPARTADGYANNPNDRGPNSPDRSYQGTNPNLCMGSLLALPPNFDINSLQTEPARILATALQNYGGYVVDDTTRDVYGLATEWGPNGNVRLDFEKDWGYPIDTTNQNSAWLKDIHRMFQNLQVIVNQNEANIAGGPSGDTANRRAPEAPPFAN